MQTVFHFLSLTSVITWISIQFLSIQMSSGMRVHLNYTSPSSQDHSVPDDVDITLSLGPNSSTHLNLKRVKEINPNVPVYVLSTGADGKFVQHKANLPDSENIGYYQDVANEAVIQITRTNALGEKTAHLVLEGELRIGGHKYKLNPEKRVKRDAPSSSTPSSPSPSSSEDEETSPSHHHPYNLIPQDKPQSKVFDYLIPPPEVRIVVHEANQPDTLRPILSVSPPSLPSTSSLSSSLSSTRSKRSSRSSFTRRRRQAVQNYYIDVVAVIDYGSYRRFAATSSSRADTLRAMRVYYAFIFNGADLRFRSITTTDYRVHIRLIKLIIADTAAGAPFTERFRVTDAPWDEISAQQSLTAFSDFAAGSGREIIGPYDSAMLFTGYDLTSTLTVAANTNATTGLSYISTLCRTDGKSVSVVEDLGGFQSIDTVAHELGHGLSATHDGDGNTCRSSDRYIMAGSSSRATQSNKFNPWIFSQCSVNSFTNFFNSLLRTARGQACLLLPLSISSNVPNVSDRLPGQEYSPDQQCRMIYGSSSRLCRGTEFGATSNICTSMFCFDPTTVGTCYEQTAARGTTCGDGRMCLDGQCVSDSRAPRADDDCVFGDQPGIAFEGMTCPEFVNNFSGYCYQALVRGRCCSSCQAARTNRVGCEYGDTVSGCSASVCRFASTLYLQQCCGTCNYGATNPATTSTRITTTTTTTTTTRKSTSRRTTTTTTPSVNQCLDRADVLVNGMRCAAAVATYPRFCYQDNVYQACCASCERINSGKQGCEYGDLYPTSCQTVTSCVNLQTECCETCASGQPPTTQAPVCQDRPSSTLNCQFDISANPSLCINNAIRQQCCLSCRNVISAPVTTTLSPPGTSGTAPVCQDRLNVLVNDMTCKTAVQQNPSLCYASNVQQVCCLSCKRAKSGDKGCEYGDMYPNDCKSLTNCLGSESKCCASCPSGASGGGSRETTANAETTFEATTPSSGMKFEVTIMSFAIYLAGQFIYTIL